MSDSVAIHWFRQDLRLSDNPSLTYCSQNHKVLPIYIFDNVNSDVHQMGRASEIWLKQSLQDLSASLSGNLVTLQGDPIEIMLKLCQKNNVTLVAWNRCYEPWRISRDKKLKTLLEDHGITVKTFNGSLLWEPWTVSKKDQTPYKVFTPFYRKGCLLAPPPREPLDAPKNCQYAKAIFDGVNEYAITSQSSASWSIRLQKQVDAGENNAQLKLETFFKKLINYKKGRDFPK